MWDGITGHTFKLPLYRFYDHGNDREKLELGEPPFATDIRRTPLKGAAYDITDDKLKPKHRNYSRSMERRVVAECKLADSSRGLSASGCED